MAQKIIRIGSSLGITIPKNLLVKIGVSLGDEVSLSYNNRKTAIEVQKEEQKLDEQTIVIASHLLDAYADELDKVK